MTTDCVPLHAAWRFGATFLSAAVLFLFAASTAARAADAWTADPMERVTPESVGKFSKQPAAIRLVAPVNGYASGQVVIKGDAKGAVLTAFAGADGATLPAAAGRVRYAVQKTAQMQYTIPFCDVLVEAPADGALQPVWVTVKPPAGTKPGKYTATLTVAGIRVPVELLVCNYTMPEPKDWGTWVDLMQSPESIAYQYDVPLWSDRHLKLLTKSLDLMGQLGNRVVYATVVRDTFFGNRDSLIVFRKKNGQYKPDFTFFDRYLELYVKHVGEPVRLVVYVWGSLPLGDRSGAKVAPRLTELHADGTTELYTAPEWGEAGSADLWKGVMDGVQERVKARGWKECIIHVGCGTDATPSTAAVADIKKVAPYARWVFWTHGYNGAGANSPRNECVSGYVTYPDLRQPRPAAGKSNIRGGWMWKAEDLIKANSFRDWITDYSRLEHWRCVVEAATGSPATNTTGTAAGIGRMGLDYWPVVEPGQKTAAPILRGAGGMNRLTRRGPRAASAPGPEGALATVRFEMLREGTQECEARIQIEKAMVAGKLSPETRKAADEFLLQWTKTKWDAPDEIGEDGRTNTRIWAVGENWRENTAKLYNFAGEAARAMPSGK